MKKFTFFHACLLSSSTFHVPIIWILALFCTFTVSIQAQTIKPTISIQGTLKTASGASVEDGTVTVTFRLYDAESGGTKKWEETADVEIIGGLYSHYLGSVMDLNPADFSTTLWLAIKEGASELSPRSRLSYSPYAFSVYTAVCSGAVGDIKYSYLDPVEFAKVNGACWVPMDGRALAPTDKLRLIPPYPTNVPNGGGVFLRAQEYTGSEDDPGRTSATAVATLQQDDNKSHTHPNNLSIGSDGAHTHTYNDRSIDESTGSGDYADGDGTGQQDPSRTTGSAGAHTHPINGGVLASGTESRPKNLNFWIYIRIN